MAAFDQIDDSVPRASACERTNSTAGPGVRQSAVSVMTKTIQISHRMAACLSYRNIHRDEIVIRHAPREETWPCRYHARGSRHRLQTAQRNPVELRSHPGWNDAREGE